MANLLFYLILSFLLATLLTPLARKMALRLGVFAHTNHRTMHQGRMPKWGGVAMFGAFAIAAGVLLVQNSDLSAEQVRLILSLVAGACMICILGTFDDKLDLACNLKLGVELAAAVIAVSAGWRMETLMFPGNQALALGVLSVPISVLWIVGVVNAVNLIDGLDGLASGVVIVAALINLAVAFLFQNPLIGVLSIVLVGATAGFLRYNLFPASIFMGDSGSLTLGFLLACLTIQGASVSMGQIAIVVPLLLLAIPLTDTVLAIVRRLRRGIHPFHADQEHIHHRLVRLGLSQSGAALFMVGLSFILGVLAFLIAQGIHTDLELFSHFPRF